MKTVDLYVDDHFIKGSGGNIGALGTHDALQFRIHFNESWDGLSKRICWLDARRENAILTVLTPTMLEDPEDETVYLVPVPVGPMNWSGSMVLTIKGTETKDGVEEKALLTAFAEFEVSQSLFDNSAEAAQEIPATIAEQIMQELENVKSEISSAVKAASDAETYKNAAKDYSENAKAIAIEGSVPQSRTVNGHELVDDVTVRSKDIPVDIINVTPEADFDIAHNTWTTVCTAVLPRGTWIVSGTMSFAANDVGYRAANIQTVSNATVYEMTEAAVPNSTRTVLNKTKIIETTKDTTVYLRCRQNSGSPLSTIGAGYHNLLGISAVRIGKK